MPNKRVFGMHSMGNLLGFTPQMDVVLVCCPKLFITIATIVIAHYPCIFLNCFLITIDFAINTWFERISILVILLNCITLGMYQPCVDDACVTNRCKILQVSAKQILKCKKKKNVMMKFIM